MIRIIIKIYKSHKCRLPIIKIFQFFQEILKIKIKMSLTISKIKLNSYMQIVNMILLHLMISKNF